MRRIAIPVVLVATLTPMLAVASPVEARTGVPRGFFGVVPQGSLASVDFQRMRDVVGTLRIPIYWPQVEPRKAEFDFDALDSVVTKAAASGVRVLPFVYGTPSWLEPNPARPPLGRMGRTAWSDFLRALVGRYGPRGTVWDEAPLALPIRRWQIWNEPNFLLFWRPSPSPPRYARLLHISAHAIRAADRGARIVAAGVAPVEGGMLPWTFMRQLYEVAGVRSSFDLAAVHPYSSTLAGVTFQIARARRVMAAAGDGEKPLLVSELGVASASRLPTSFDRGLKGQAGFLRRAYGRLIEQRGRWRIGGVYWYSWRDMSTPDPHCVFCEHAGLFDAASKPKPAWRAFRRLATTRLAYPERIGGGR